MGTKKFIRGLHRYLSIFIAIQLLLWTVSGIYFAFNKIELVRNTIAEFTQEYTKLKSEIDPLKTHSEIKELIYKERLSILRKVSS